MTEPLIIPRKDYILRETSKSALGQAEIENYLAIELWAKGISGGGGFPIFDFPGPLVIAVFDIYVAPAAQQFAEILFGIAVAGSGTISVDIRVNTVVVQTVNIPPGVNVYDAKISPVISLARLDALQLSISAPGGGGGLTGMVLVA